MATKDEIFAFAAQEAERQGVPLSLVQGVVDTESGGAFNAIGPKTKTGDRAYGPMQLMATTAKDLGVNRMEWKDNIRGGVKYLSQLSQRYDNPDLVLAAYNAGLGNVDKYGGIPPFKETQNYVQKVKNFMAKSTTDDEFVPFGQGTATQAPAQTVGTDDFVPFTGSQKQVQQQPQQTGGSQFMQDVQASFNPLDVLRGKTTSGQLIFGTANLMSQGIKGGLSALGLSDEYLGIDRTKPQPVAQPTPSISDILKGTYKVATERPGLLVGGLGTSVFDPTNLVLPGGIQKSIIAGTPTRLLQAAPKTTALTQNVLTGSTTAGITSAAGQAANTGTINPLQLANETVAGALMTLPTATVSGLSTPKTPVVLDRKQQIAQAAIQQGATLPPSQVNPSILNSILEGISGKQTTQQVASIKNQKVINTQARKTLGLADDVEITPQVLQDYRNVKGQAYDALRANPAYYSDKQFLSDINKRTAEIQKRGTLVDTKQELDLLDQLKQLRFDGDALVEKIKVLRSDSDINFRSNDADKLRLANVQKFAARQLEDLAERNLTNFNQPDVMTNFRQARQDIAKSYTIEKALNAATGDVSGAKLGQRAAAGKMVPSELKALADAAATYKQSFQNPSAIGSVPYISPLDLATAAIASASTANPMVMGAALTRPALRAGITSGVYQRNMLPNTQVQTPGLLNRITSDPLTNYGLGQIPQFDADRFLLPR
jgi:hypothetical protein